MKQYSFDSLFADIYNIHEFDKHKLSLTITWQIRKKRTNNTEYDMASNW